MVPAVLVALLTKVELALVMIGEDEEAAVVRISMAINFATRG